jgi:5-formyltetrahydrofolate cyclo-ligase
LTAENKKALREKLIRLRTGLAKDQVYSKSLDITKKLQDMDIFKNSGFILCYVDFKNEVMTRDFIRQSLKKGKKVAVPLVECGANGQKKMLASQIHSVDNDLQTGFCNICEPKKECVMPVDPLMLDLIIVPGIAFDREKNRLGYGGGFFDSFMRKVKNNCTKAALAFDIQIVDRIPAEPHDVKVDMIITEAQTIL